jgi:glioma pathogenesis-related protein 2
MTESWYNESSKYDYHNPSYQPGTGHFTQIVWKGSQEVGFAQASGASMNYAVAMYYPPGNYMGEFSRNVFAAR